eukprot:6177152-Pleurochrysis_carterae.AAC.3
MAQAWFQRYLNTADAWLGRGVCVSRERVARREDVLTAASALQAAGCPPECGVAAGRAALFQSRSLQALPAGQPAHARTFVAAAKSWKTLENWEGGGGMHTFA